MTKHMSWVQLALMFPDAQDSSPSVRTPAPRIRPVATPFVKWPGGKSRLIGEILARAPSHYERYLEPFVGGGAVALALGHDQMLINDANVELMDTYRAVRDHSIELLSALDEYRHSHINAQDRAREFYLSVREQDPFSLDLVRRAARFIYLNKTGFNGLYRVNAQGRFNVPYGGSRNPTLYDKASIEAASEALRSAQLFTDDYSAFLREYARPGDLIYLDPPYIPVSVYSDFKRYTKEQFRIADHRRLAQLYNDLVCLGAYPMLSNSYTELALELYKHHRIEIVYMPRFINKDGSRRGAVAEIIVTPDVPNER